MRCYQFGPFTLDATERRLTDSAGEPIALAPRVFDVLVVLVEAGGRLVTREDFQAKIWQGTAVEERNLTVHISTLRKALGRTSSGDYIETVPRAGYRLTAPVTTVGATATVVPEAMAEAPVPAPARPASTPPATGAGPRRLATVAALLALTVLGGYLVHVARQAPVASAPLSSTLAVLPFSVVGMPGDDGRLGLGLADAVISRLSQLPELTVRPTSTIRPFTAGGDLVEIGRELGVAHVVEGVVQAANERARVIVKIVDVETGAIRWQDSFERPFVDLFGLEEAVSAGVASSLAQRMSVERTWGRQPRRPASDEAYRAYLDARARLLGNIDLDMSGATAAFQRAVALDPQFAPAWAGLARAYRSRGYSVGGNPHDYKDRARDAVNKALALDPDLPEAHTVLGILHYSYDWDWPAALRELRRATALAPRSHDAQAWLGYALYTLGHFEEGLDALHRAAALNPMSPKTQIAEAYWFMGRIDEALGMLEETIRQHPTHERPHWLRVFILDQLGRFDEAVRARRAAAQAIGDTPYLQELDVSLARGPHAVLEQDLRLRQSRGNLGDIAWLHVQLGQHEQALDALDACADQLCNTVPVLKTEARFRSLHGHPRFQALLRRLKLAAS